MVLALLPYIKRARKETKKMLSVAEIKRFIDDDITSERKRFAGIGQRYYEGKHDILNYQMFYFNGDGILVKDEYRSNIKISHPFFTLLADQHAAYMLSFKENPIRAKQIRPASCGIQGRRTVFHSRSCHVK